MTLDKKTLTHLLKLATKNHRTAVRRFNKWDNVEDMHEMNRWKATIGWLDALLTTQ